MRTRAGLSRILTGESDLACDPLTEKEIRRVRTIPLDPVAYFSLKSAEEFTRGPLLSGAAVDLGGGLVK